MPVVYLSQHRSLAVLELLVNARPGSPDEEYAIVEASWDESLMERLAERDLPPNWRAIPPADETRELGDLWINEVRSAVIAVPNVIIPAESNYLLNPAHPDFSRIKIGKPATFVFDPRLLPR